MNKYYYKDGHYLTKECKQFYSYELKDYSCVKIGSYACTNTCINIIDYNIKENYIICKHIIKQERLKKLNSL